MPCTFCEIIRGEREAYIVYSDEEVIAFLDKYPVTPGHTLVVPREHYETIMEVPTPLLSRIMEAVKILSRAMFEGLGASGVRVVQNNGRGAMQVIPHIHFHVIPFYDGVEPRRPRPLLTREEAEYVLGRLRSVL